MCTTSMHSATEVYGTDMEVLKNVLVVVTAIGDNLVRAEGAI